MVITRMIMTGSVLLALSGSLFGQVTDLEKLLRLTHDRCPLKYDHRPRSQEDISRGLFALRLYPLPLTQETLSGSLSVAEALSKSDLTAIGLAHIQRRLVQKDAQETSTKFHLYSDPLTPDTVLFFRDSGVTIFPRVLLLTPTVSSIPINDGDAIATVMYQDVKQNPRSDPFGAWIPQSQAVTRKTKTINADGILVPPTVRGRPIDTSTNPNLSSLRKFEIEKKWVTSELHSHLAASVPVVVLTRIRQGKTLRFICPLSNVGLFASNGAVFRSLYRDGKTGALLDDNALKNQWNTLFDSQIGGIEFEEGDLVEVTVIEAVHPFNSPVGDQ